MKSLLYLLLLLGVLGCRQENAPGQLPEPVVPLTDFFVDGIDPIPVSPDNSANITLPSGFQADSLRIRYRLAPGVSVLPGSPASGSVIYFKGRFVPTICLNDGTGTSCANSYKINVRYSDPLKVEPVAVSAFEMTNDGVPLGLRFYIQNLGTLGDGSPRFRARFIHQATSYIYETEHTSFEDAGKPYNVASSAKWAILRITGSIPTAMAIQTGTYKIELWAIPHNKLYVVSQPFLLKAGRPLILNAPSVIQLNQITVQALNLTPNIPGSLRLGNDFSSAQTIRGEFVSATEMRFRVAANTPSGVYLGELSLNDGKPQRYLFTIPSASSRSYFDYVAPLRTFATTYSSFPEAPKVRAGDTLEVSFRFMDLTGAAVKNDYQELNASRITLLRLDNPALRYELTSGNRFMPSYNVPYMFAWTWRIPATVPKGEYQLIFEDTNGQPSLPHYHKITIL